MRETGNAGGKERRMHVRLIILGCDKNTVDNEYLAALLEDDGCTVAVGDSFDSSDSPDAVVVTTCGFIGDAKRQSIETLLNLADRKRETGRPARIYAAGCLTQRYAAELLREVPEIDGIVGVGQFERLAQMICKDKGGNAVKTTPTVAVCRFLRRRRLDDRPYAFLKIADGCNHACTFCAIPLMKGGLHSVPRDILLREARALLDSGARELNLIAQDISVYGMDRKRGPRLPQLLRDLCTLEGDFWIRCLYCYPGGVTDELLDVMAAEPKIVPYLDLPLQHLDPEMLRRMKRPSHDADPAALVRRLRDVIPGITLRTTMLAGFPGETPAEHRRMLDGLRELAFEWLGAFQFSPEEDTVAAQLPRQVSPRTRKKRWHAIMALQTEITAAHNQARIGKRTRVLVEEYDTAGGCWTGRSPAEAPEVDGSVFIESPRPLVPGQFLDVEITRADIYDVYAREI